MRIASGVCEESSVSIPLSTPGVFRPKSRELGGKRGTFGRCDNNLLLQGFLHNKGHKCISAQVGAGSILRRIPQKRKLGSKQDITPRELLSRVRTFALLDRGGIFSSLIVPGQIYIWEVSEGRGKMAMSEGREKVKRVLITIPNTSLMSHQV